MTDPLTRPERPLPGDPLLQALEELERDIEAELHASGLEPGDTSTFEED